ncbi:MAG TPA: monovalent cation/H+ antiporter subunit A [Pirellulaceae bacterium]|nr:monovalent cation/H+ antiporter subunit A [Pirellulaceae bacterium]
MRLALIVLLPLLGALLPGLLIRTGRNACAMAAGIPTLLALALLLTHIPEIQKEVVTASFAWVPQIGMTFSFRLDGLSFLFAALILSIGLLVTLYARYYLSAKDRSGNFYTYLLLFQAAMLGVVLSENLLLLVVFWELTSLASFLLIGFWNGLEAGRRGALMALAVTGAGGLALIAAVLILGQVAGSYELSSVLHQREVIQQSSFYPSILILVLLACFTKSAQFPFHFWLPRAMAAPTPISAYLHSATMVKAGVFLLARLWPVLSGTDAWFYAVTTTGLLTMLLGAVVALMKDDLKALLAYSTVSHLGIMTMLLGMGTPIAALIAMLHLLNHALFKAALFLTAGIVDHETGVRDIRHLGGLWRWMPWTGVIALLAMAANAGLPPLGGFISKEMILEQALETGYAGHPWLVAVVVGIAASFSIAYSFRFFCGVFLGRAKEGAHEAEVGGTSGAHSHPHDPHWGLLLPPLVLAAAALAVGLWPGELAEPLVAWAASAVRGDQPLTESVHLKLWHGVSPALYFSAGAIGVGVLLFAMASGVRVVVGLFARWDLASCFDKSLTWAVRGATWLTAALHNGSLQRYVLITLIGFLCMGGAAYASAPYEVGTRPLLPAVPPAIVGWVLVIGVCLATILFYRQRLTSLITVNVIGLIASIAFIYLSAPDLALTQIAVEVVTLILILLAMYFLPKESPRESSTWRLVRDGVVAVVFGASLGWLAWSVMTSNFETIADHYIRESKPAGGGANVVNVILVDFRGFDTFNEIMVLGIAALGIYALLDGAMHGRAASRLDTWKPDQPQSPDRHPSLLVVPTRIMLPLALMVGAYIFLRGHNHPGGGFVAGLIVTIALIMQYMVSGYEWANERISINYHAWIGWGIWLAAGAGIGAMVMNYPFLTNAHHHFHSVWLGEFELASALVFDAGVLLAVVGAVMLALANLSRMGRRAFKAAQRAVEQGITDVTPKIEIED